MAKKKKVYNPEKDKALVAEIFYHKVIVEGVEQLRKKYQVPDGGLITQDDYIKWEEQTDMGAFLTDIGRLLTKFKSTAHFQIHSLWVELLKRYTLFYEFPNIDGVSYPDFRLERNSITGENELWISPTPYTSREDWEYAWGDVERFREMQKSPWPDEKDKIFKNRVRDSINLEDDKRMLEYEKEGLSVKEISEKMKIPYSSVNSRLYKFKIRFGYSSANPGE